MNKLIALFLGFFLAFSSGLITVDIASCDAFEENNQSRWLYRIYDSDSDMYGYIDNKGNLVIKPQFYLGQEIFQDLGFVEIKGKSGYIDGSGEFIIPHQFDDAEAFSDGLALVELNGKKGFINEKGEIQFMLDSRGHGFSEGLAYISIDNDNWGAIDKTGKLVIGPIPKDKINCWWDFSEGLMVIMKKRKYG